MYPTPISAPVTTRRIPADGNKKEQVNVRLTTTARKILSDLSMRLGISQADVLELILREEKKKRDG